MIPSAIQALSASLAPPSPRRTSRSRCPTITSPSSHTTMIPIASVSWADHSQSIISLPLPNFASPLNNVSLGAESNLSASLPSTSTASLSFAVQLLLLLLPQSSFKIAARAPGPTKMVPNLTAVSDGFCPPAPLPNHGSFKPTSLSSSSSSSPHSGSHSTNSNPSSNPLPTPSTMQVKSSPPLHTSATL